MPEPFVFSYDMKRQKREKEIFTPPFIHFPSERSENVPAGMYVMLTGIDGLRSLFERVHKFGIKLYCPPFVKDIEGADNRFAPDFVANPNIKYQFARTGWSTVWWSHMTQTPLITPKYVQGDDPEIYFNEKSVSKLGIASLFDGSSNPEEVLRQADLQKEKMRNLNRRLSENYGTLDGMNYTAKIIVDDIEEKDISVYRSVKPALKQNKKYNKN